MRSKISGGREDGIEVSGSGLVRHAVSSKLGVSGRYLQRDVACGPGKSFGLSPNATRSKPLTYKNLV